MHHTKLQMLLLLQQRLPQPPAFPVAGAGDRCHRPRHSPSPRPLKLHSASAAPASATQHTPLQHCDAAAARPPGCPFAAADHVALDALIAAPAGAWQAKGVRSRSELLLGPILAPSVAWPCDSRQIVPEESAGSMPLKQIATACARNLHLALRLLLQLFSATPTAPFNFPKLSTFRPLTTPCLPP